MRVSFYQMATVIFSDARLDAIRERLVELAGGTYCHTNKKVRGTPVDRGDIVEMVEVITQASEWNVVAVELLLADSSQGDITRARALCLDPLVRNLVNGTGDEAVRGIVADNKDTALNKLDHQAMENLRGTGLISWQMGFAHGRVGDERLLWSAVAVSWAVQRNIVRDDGRFLEPTLREGTLTMIDAVDGKLLNLKHPLGASYSPVGRLPKGRDYPVAGSTTLLRFQGIRVDRDR